MGGRLFWSSLWCSNPGYCRCKAQRKSPIVQIDVRYEGLMVGTVSLNHSRAPQNSPITQLLVFLVLLFCLGLVDFSFFFSWITKHVYTKFVFIYTMSLCQVLQLAAYPLPYVLTTGQIWDRDHILVSKIGPSDCRTTDLGLRCNNPEGISLTSWCQDGVAGRRSDDPCCYLGFVSSFFKVKIRHCILHWTKLFETQTWACSHFSFCIELYGAELPACVSISVRCTGKQAVASSKDFCP